MYLSASGTCLLYVFDSDMEAHVNMLGFDREIVVTFHRVPNLVEMFLRVGEFIRNREVFKV